MKITSHFLSETVVADSIEFQKLSFKIAISKLKSTLIGDDVDETLFKNLQYITDNLLLSLRMAEMYLEAVDVLNELNKFLKKFNLDLKYIELIILNWCKIKRDGSKVQSKVSAKCTKKTYEENLKYKTINKLLKTINTDYTIDYLFEELRVLKYFSTIDSSIQMYDEILCVLNEINLYLESNIDTRCLSEITNTKSKKTDEQKIDVNINKCRLYLEVAQFFWLKHMCTQNQYFQNSICNQLSSDQALDMASNVLKFHKCLSSKTPTISTTRSKKCQCVDYQILKFQLNLYKMLNEYADYREEMCKSIKSLISLRLKIKNTENTQTNTDNLQHISSTQSSLKYLLCSEIHNNAEKNTYKQTHFLKLLENLYENLADIQIDVDLFHSKLISLRKQLYALIDLLAHLFGFFCVPIRKIDCLKLKFSILSKELNFLPPTNPLASPAISSVTGISTNLSSSNDTYLTIYTITILNLMKSYLNLHQFKQLNELNAFLFQKTFDKCASDGDYNNENLISIEKHKLFTNKPELIVTYYLINAHYFLLKQNFQDAIKIIKNKILNSTILCGRQTAPYYEAKYYLKYLLFILSTLNCK